MFPKPSLSAQGSGISDGAVEGVARVQPMVDVHVAWLHRAVREMPSWLVSTIFHLVVLVILAALTLPAHVADKLIVLKGEQLDTNKKFDDDPPKIIQTSICTNFSSEVLEPRPPVAQSKEITIAAVELPQVVDQKSMRVGMDIFSALPSAGELLARPQGDGDLDGKRGRGYKDRLPTPEGRAVGAALKWLARHQLPDGGWSFDHRLATDCRGKCSEAGNMAEARVAATGLALLPFLGAGMTHRKGEYKATVRDGLYFLIARMKFGASGGSLYEPGGRMYSHGIASIALSEAAAMSRDRKLRDPVYAALAFTRGAQDPVGGGWRYEPRQPGDTSVVGWQIMALKSGQLGQYDTAGPTTRAAVRFLDSVQFDGGARYGYTGPGRGSPATTAIGLLCRMYLGWERDRSELERGVQWIARKGPAPTDMYYNYYATQVMRHWDGPLWRQWDRVMKRQLIDSQASGGHQKGSWHFDHPHARQGGRLYSTAMAAMILEVYYRYLPLYQQQSVEESFPL